MAKNGLRQRVPDVEWQQYDVLILTASSNEKQALEVCDIIQKDERNGQSLRVQLLQWAVSESTEHLNIDGAIDKAVLLLLLLTEDIGDDKEVIFKYCAALQSVFEQREGGTLKVIPVYVPSKRAVSYYKKLPSCIRAVTHMDLNLEKPKSFLDRLWKVLESDECEKRKTWILDRIQAKYQSASNFIKEEQQISLCNTSLDLTAQYHPPSELTGNDCNGRSWTTYLEYMSSTLQPIVLITDDVQKWTRMMQGSGKISIIQAQTLINLMRATPAMSSEFQPGETAFIRTMLTKSLYVCIDQQSLQKEEYVECLYWLQEKRKKMFEEVASVLKITALLFGDTESLPDQLKEFFMLRLKADLHPEKIAQFLEDRERHRYETVESIVKEINSGARQLVFLKPRLPGFDNENYLMRSYEALLEVFEDAGSHPRQQLQQLLHLPNVQTVRSLCDPNNREVCIEIQPNTLEDYLEFLLAYHSGQFSSMVGNNLRVKYESYVGIVKTRIETGQIIPILKYFNQSTVKKTVRQLERLVQIEKLDEVVQIIKEETRTKVRSEERLPSLSQMCASVIYARFLQRHDLLPFEYVRFMKENGCADCLNSLRDWDGYNALHLAVKYEREDHLKMMFYTNRWAVLNNEVVKPVNKTLDHLHIGYSARRLAEALSFRTRGYEMLVKFDEYDRYIRLMPALHKACLIGSLELSSALVQYKAKLINQLDEYGANCLLYASASGNSDLVEFLIRKGASTEIKNRHGEMPLHVAAMCGHLNIVDVFSRHFVDIQVPLNDHDYNAKYFAVRFGHLDILKLYVEKGYKLNGSMLTIVSKHGQREMFDFILNQISNVNEGRDEEGRLAIHYSVINGAESEVRRLLEKAADITLVDRYNKNVFHHAAEHGRDLIGRILVEEAKRRNCLEKLLSAKDWFSGKDLFVVVCGKDRGRKAWHWIELKRLSVREFNKALKSGQLDVKEYGNILVSGYGTGPDKKTRKLMKKKSDDLVRVQKPDMTPLGIGAFKNHSDIVSVLLESGADPNAVDYKGATAMHFCALNDNVQMMGLLLDAGSLQNVKTDDGKTPVEIAEENDNQAARNFLLDYEPIQKARELRHLLSDMKKSLSFEGLQEVRAAGDDIRRHIVFSLRKLTVDVNRLLMDLGSGPIQQVSEN